MPKRRARPHIGDRVLQEVANRLRENVHASETVCRQGGDERVTLPSNPGSSGAPRDPRIRLLPRKSPRAAPSSPETPPHTANCGNPATDLARLRLFAPIFHVTPCLAVTAGAKVGTTRHLVDAGFQGGGDPRWGLRGQLQTQLLEQQLLLGLRLGVTAQDQGASISGR